MKKGDMYLKVNGRYVKTAPNTVSYKKNSVVCFAVCANCCKWPHKSWLNNKIRKTIELGNHSGFKEIFNQMYLTEVNDKTSTKTGAQLIEFVFVANEIPARIKIMPTINSELDRIANDKWVENHVRKVSQKEKGAKQGKCTASSAIYPQAKFVFLNDGRILRIPNGEQYMLVAGRLGKYVRNTEGEFDVSLTKEQELTLICLGQQRHAVITRLHIDAEEKIEYLWLYFHDGIRNGLFNHMTGNIDQKENVEYYPLSEADLTSYS